MQTIDHTIAEMIRAYPYRFGCRTDVLNYFFCTIGNGMDWEKGRLVPSSPIHLRSLEERIEDIKSDYRCRVLLETLKDELEIKSDLDKDSRLKLAKLNSTWKKAELVFRYNYADDLALNYGDIESIQQKAWLKAHPIYPLYENACMNSVPDNVMPDWLAAVRETILIVFKAPAIQPEEQETVEQCEQARINNIKFADNVLQSLYERFGPSSRFPDSYGEFCLSNNKPNNITNSKNQVQGSEEASLSTSWKI